MCMVLVRKWVNVDLMPPAAWACVEVLAQFFTRLPWKEGSSASCTVMSRLGTVMWRAEIAGFLTCQSHVFF